MFSRVATTCIYLTGMFAFAQEVEQTPYPLPTDAKEAVFIYDERNGFTPPRQNAAPVLTIRTDGTIEMPTLYGQGRDITGKFSQQELQDFLTFVIEKNKFFEFDEAKVRAEMKEARLKREIPSVADAPDNIFEVRLADRKHSVRQYAVGAASQYQEIEALQQLSAIQRRVNQLKSVTRVGGQKGIATLRKQANAALRKEYPEIKPFTKSEFSGSYLRENGTISATFARVGMNNDGKPNGTYVRAIMEIPASDGLPTVVLRVKLKR